MTKPKPAAAPFPQGGIPEPVIGMVTILVYDWAPRRSQIRIKLPAEAEPGQPNALDVQDRFRARLNADLDDAFREFGGP